MSLIAWSSVFSVGVADIDEQHKQLIGLANQLNDAVRAGQGDAVVGRILAELLRYTQYHFAFEESLMDRHAYPRAAEHKQQHAELVRTVEELRLRCGRRDSGMEAVMMGFLRDWLTRHLMNSDRALGADLNAKGVR